MISAQSVVFQNGIGTKYQSSFVRITRIEVRYVDSWHH